MYDADNFQSATQIIAYSREVFVVGFSLHVRTCILQIIYLKYFHLSK